MKAYFSSKTMIALAVAVAAAAAIETEANEQPIPPPATSSALPDSIQPGSPVAQVVKLVQAGVDASVIQIYISNCPTAFNLDADKIIALTDVGLPSDLVNAMFAHDKNFLNSLSTAAPPAPDSPPVQVSSPPPAATPAPAPAPPTQEVTVNYFTENLSPYGSWVEVDGYGRCWRPNVVVYDTGWRPYCDRGRWVYTDCGWYWESDYSWGVTFHYGRWFSDARYGWCWWPDTVWAPSWVTWRSSNDYCGWAPLPPFTVYNPGVGFCYRGNNVAVSFDFGLAANCFTFVSIGNFCQPHPRHYCVPPTQVNNFYNSTVIVNNFGCNQKTICNNGVSVTVIGNSAHHPIQAVPVHSMGAPGRHGGGSPYRFFGTDASDNSATRNFAGTELRHGPVYRHDNGNDSRPNNNGNDATTVRHAPFAAPTQAANHPAENPVISRAPSAPTPTQADNSRQNQNHQNPFAARGSEPVSHPVQQPTQVAVSPVNNNPVPSPSPAHNPGRGYGNSTADDNRQAHQPTRNYTYTAPQTGERPQASAPARTPMPVASAPAVSTERSQPFRSEPRQNYNFSSAQAPSQPATRNFAPSAPAPSQSQPSGNGGNGRGQNWFAQNGR